mmetsp:Transcript_23221/g.37297  ORF Transcript_23221/g.37297 Transcript_23221/m.37297 type:complete len:235 (-) Transcript_23221:865-1569(-)
MVSLTVLSYSPEKVKTDRSSPSSFRSTGSIPHPLSSLPATTVERTLALSQQQHPLQHLLPLPSLFLGLPPPPFLPSPLLPARSSTTSLVSSSLRFFGSCRPSTLIFAAMLWCPSPLPSLRSRPPKALAAENPHARLSGDSYRSFINCFCLVIARLARISGSMLVFTASLFFLALVNVVADCSEFIAVTTAISSLLLLLTLRFFGETGGRVGSFVFSLPLLLQMLFRGGRASLQG